MEIKYFIPDKNYFYTINEYGVIAKKTKRLFATEDKSKLHLKKKRFLTSRYSVFFDDDGKVAIPVKYKNAYDFEGGVARVSKEGRFERGSDSYEGKWGLIDESGKEVTGFEYEEIGSYKDGLMCVKKEGKWGYIDNTGKVVIDLIYDEAFDFNNERACIKINGKYGAIDPSGKIIIEPQYSEAFCFNSKNAFVEKDGQSYMIDKNGKKIVSDVDEELDTEEKESPTIEKISIEELRKSYDRVGDFYNGFAPVKKDGLWGFVDKFGKEIAPCKYHEVGSFREGLARVECNYITRFIDETGREVFKCRLAYKKVKDFSGGLAWVDKGNSVWAVIDREGNELDYDKVYDYCKGFTKVQKKGLFGVLNKYGKEIIPCEYGEIKDIQNGLFIVSKRIGDKVYYGCIDENGNEILPCEKAVIQILKDGGIAYLEVGEENRWGYLDKDGRELLEPEYANDEIFRITTGNLSNEQSSEKLNKFFEARAKISAQEAKIKIEECEDEEKIEQIVNEFKDEIAILTIQRERIEEINALEKDDEELRETQNTKGKKRKRIITSSTTLKASNDLDPEEIEME